MAKRKSRSGKSQRSRFSAAAKKCKGRTISKFRACMRKLLRKK